MNKIDLKKTFKNFYTGKAGVINELMIPPLPYLMIDGKGDPNTAPQFAEFVGYLYGVAYTMKFSLKKTGKTPDYGVMPLQGLWWCEDMSAFTEARKDEWKWTLMILQPEFITRKLLDEALVTLMKRKELTAKPPVRLETLDEGDCVQALHIGTYAEEASLIQKMHKYIADKGWKLRGRHHEIYLSDPRRTDPKKLKTLIRQPFSK